MERSESFGRRTFFRYAAAGAAAIPALPFLAKLRVWAQETTPEGAASGGPANPSWRTVIPPAGEPGEPLIVSGVIYAPDGNTPVEGARLYVYHTDARGYYRYPSNSSENPRLRGWMKADAQGRYEFRTVRPGSYPNSRNPQHIHATLGAPGYATNWIDEFHFLDDPLLPEREKAAVQRDGEFSAVLRVTRGADGIWRAVRHLRLRR